MTAVALPVACLKRSLILILLSVSDRDRSGIYEMTSRAGGRRQAMLACGRCMRDHAHAGLRAPRPEFVRSTP